MLIGSVVRLSDDELLLVSHSPSIFGQPHGRVYPETELSLHSVSVCQDIVEPHGMIATGAVSGGILLSGGGNDGWRGG